MPPNLDEILNSFINKKVRRTSSGQDTTPSNFFISSFFLIILVVMWFLSGFVIVKPPEEGVVLRFGQFDRILDPGLHWIPRIADTVQIVNVENIYDYEYQANMLTADENITDIELNVQYRIDNSRDFLYNSEDPINTVNQSTASALRQIVGETSLDQILTVGRMQVRDEVRSQLNDILNIYQLGVMITDVRLQAARPPVAVKAAFDDAVKAREDEQRYINEAKAYASKVTPIAEGRAKRTIIESEAYKDRVILEAVAKTAIYNSLVEQYEANPDVIKTAIYYRSMERVMKQTPKLLLNIDKGSNSFVYLPLDQIVRSQKMALQKDETNKSSLSMSGLESMDQSAYKGNSQTYGTTYQSHTWGG